MYVYIYKYIYIYIYIYILYMKQGATDIALYVNIVTRNENTGRTGSSTHLC